MPDKRNVSKQRRAARNRQTRDAVAARRENAVIVPSSSSSRTSASSSSSGSSRTTAKDSRAKPSGGRAAPAGRGGRPRPTFVAYEPPDPGLKGVLTGRRSGDRWVLAAFVLAIASAAYSLLATQIAADDRGEALPNQYAGLTVAAREAISGQPIGDKTISMVSAYGPIAFVLVGTPILITAFALWANRRPDRGRVLTYCLIAMAGAVMLSATSVFVFLPVVALGVATFRVRKTDMVLTGAEAPADAPSDRGARGGAIEADTVDDDDDDEVADPTPAASGSFLDRLLGGGAGGGKPSRARRGPEDPAVAEDVVDDEPVDADVIEVESTPANAPGEADPLAELEAELAAEAESDRSGDAGDDAASGSGRGRRKR